MDSRRRQLNVRKRTGRNGAKRIRAAGIGSYSKPCIVHREGAGVVTLRGLTNQCRALYKVTYGGNIAIPTGGAVGAITAALAVNGEALTSATATVTPAAVENYFNIYVSAQVCVPKGCCLTVAMKNTSTQAVSFANSNLTVERIA